ncbi:MAG: hypothetical protein WCN92_05020 [Eubacteriales bacterium]
MKKNKFFQSWTVLLIAVSFINLAACSGKQETTTTTTTTTQEITAFTKEPAATSAAGKTTTAKTDQTAEYGKVTVIKGTKITVAIGTMKQRSGNSNKIPTGSNATQGTMPSRNQQGTPPSGGMPELLTLSGESKTFTVTDSVKITKMNIMELFGRPSDQQTTATTAATGDSATLSDIAVGSILKINYKTGTDTVASIEIISINFPGGFNPGGQNGVSTTAATGN